MKIMEYNEATSLTQDNVFLIDGNNGTKKINASTAIFGALGLASPHNRRLIFRGASLGTSVTQAQRVAINSGTFDNLWLGDYWTIGGRNWRIVDFDYWYAMGDTEFVRHHLVIMPDTTLANAAMNSTASTEGGYTGSDMYATNMESSKSIIEGAFGDMVLSHREYLINTVTGGYPSSGAWTPSTIELPNEPMIFGSYIYTPSGNGSINVKRYTSSATQLALFRACPNFIHKPDGVSSRINYWLRDVANATSFIRVSSYGAPQDTSASQSYGIRPVFAIG